MKAQINSHADQWKRVIGLTGVGFDANEKVGDEDVAEWFESRVVRRKLRSESISIVTKGLQLH
jgi:hypothetical protein